MSFQENFPNKTPSAPLEKIANYEGNYSLLFMERLGNQELKEKLATSLAREYIFKYYHKNPAKGEENIEKIKEEIKKTLDARVEKVFNSTGVNLEEKNNPGYGKFGEPGWVCPYALAKQVGIEKDGPLPTKLLNQIEAHEKGHGIRTFNDISPVGIWIKSCLDSSKIEVTEDDLSSAKLFFNYGRNKPLTDEEIMGRLKKDLSADEIVERMAQFKNYFGMKGNEKFTKEHLDYIRKNYIKDMGWPSQIKDFIDSITLETEKNFLDVINNLGV